MVLSGTTQTSTSPNPGQLSDVLNDEPNHPMQLNKQDNTPTLQLIRVLFYASPCFSFSHRSNTMYPSLPGVNDPPRVPYGYGSNSVPSTPQYAAASGQGGASTLTSAHSLENSPWGVDSTSILRVKIADDYKLDPPVSSS